MSVSTMNAIQVQSYGDVDQLKLEQIRVPEPQTGEVLVRVHAAGVNPADWKIRAGWLKNFRPLTFPYIPGADLAGVVEKVGPGVTLFQPGQEVFGRCPFGSHGSYAEYTVVPVSTLALKPETLSFDEAATVPLGATTAWQGLFDHGNLQEGQRVLILGGAGGVGLFAVQLARWKGAHVIATASARNVDFVRSLGADQVIDYTQTRIEDVVHDVDLVYDTVGGSTLGTIFPVIRRGGTLVSIADQPDEERARDRNVRTATFALDVNHDLLNRLARLINEGHVKTSVGEIFPLNEAGKAQTLSQSGHGRGRIVLHIA